MPGGTQAQQKPKARPERDDLGGKKTQQDKGTTWEIQKRDWIGEGHQHSPGKSQEGDWVL